MHARSSRIPIRPADVLEVAGRRSVGRERHAGEHDRERGGARDPPPSRRWEIAVREPQQQVGAHQAEREDPDQAREPLRLRNVAERHDQHAPERADHEHEPPGRVLGAAERHEQSDGREREPGGHERERTHGRCHGRESSASLIPVRTRPPDDRERRQREQRPREPSKARCVLRSLVHPVVPSTRTGSPYRASCAGSRGSPRRWERVEPPPRSRGRPSAQLRSPSWRPNRQVTGR